MKKVLTLTLIGLLSTFVIASCGTKKKGSCDAYGSIDNVENTDIASK
jgi:hypothetical protein